MSRDWLQRISPCARPLPQGNPRQDYTGEGVYSARWIEPLRVIYDHQLVLFTQSRFRVEVEGREFDCPAGSYLIIPPATRHITWNVGTQPGRRRWSHFDWVYGGPHDPAPAMTYHPARPKAHYYRFAPDFVPKGILSGTIRAPEQVDDLYDRLYQMQALGNSRERFASRAVLLELLLNLLAAREDDQPGKAHSSRLASRVRERLKNAVESGREIPPIQVMLAEFRYSYAHLCRLFRAAYGIPPLKYVHALRIDRAKRLLRDTTLNVSEIAFKIGFSDVSYFCQLFHRMTGRSPLAYRNANRLPLQEKENDPPSVGAVKTPGSSSLPRRPRFSSRPRRSA